MRLDTRGTILRVAALVTVIFCVAPAQAHAYLDAGSASLIFQALIGATAAGIVIGRTYWQRVKTIFGFNAEAGKVD